MGAMDKGRKTISTMCFTTTTHVFLVLLAIIDLCHQIRAVADLSQASGSLLAVKSIYQSPWANDDVSQVRSCQRDTDCLLDFGRLSVCSTLFKVCVFCPIPRMCQQDYGEHCSSDFQCTKRPNLVCFMATCTCAHGAAFKNGDCELLVPTKRLSTTSLLATGGTSRISTFSTETSTAAGDASSTARAPNLTIKNMVVADSTMPSLPAFSPNTTQTTIPSAETSKAMSSASRTSSSAEMSTSPSMKATSELVETTPPFLNEETEPLQRLIPANKAVSKREAPTTLFYFGTVVEPSTNPTPNEENPETFLNLAQRTISVQPPTAINGNTNANPVESYTPEFPTAISVTMPSGSTNIPENVNIGTTVVSSSSTSEAIISTTPRVAADRSTTVAASSELFFTHHVDDMSTHATTESTSPVKNSTANEISAMVTDYHQSSLPPALILNPEQSEGETTSSSPTGQKEASPTTVANIVQEWIPGDVTRLYPATGADATTDVREDFFKAPTTSKSFQQATKSTGSDGDVGFTLDLGSNSGLTLDPYLLPHDRGTSPARDDVTQQADPVPVLKVGEDVRPESGDELTTTANPGAVDINIDSLLYPIYRVGEAHEATQTDTLSKTTEVSTHLLDTSPTAYSSQTLSTMEDRDPPYTDGHGSIIEEFLLPAQARFTVGQAIGSSTTNRIYEETPVNVDSLLYPSQTQATESTIESFVYPNLQSPGETSIDPFLYPINSKTTSATMSYQDVQVAFSNPPPPESSPTDHILAENPVNVDSLLYPFQTEASSIESFLYPNLQSPGEASIDPFLYPINSEETSATTRDQDLLETSSKPLPTEEDPVSLQETAWAKGISSTETEATSGVDGSTEVMSRDISITTTATNTTTVPELRTTSFRPERATMVETKTTTIAPPVNRGVRGGRKAVFQLKGPQIDPKEEASLISSNVVPVTSVSQLSTTMSFTHPRLTTSRFSPETAPLGVKTMPTFPERTTRGSFAAYDESSTDPDVAKETAENWFDYWNHVFSHHSDSHPTATSTQTEPKTSKGTPFLLSDPVGSLEFTVTSSPEQSSSTELSTTSVRSAPPANRNILAILLAAAALTSPGVLGTSTIPNNQVISAQPSPTPTPSATIISTLLVSQPRLTKPKLPPIVPPKPQTKSINETTESMPPTIKQTSATNLALTIMGTVAMVLTIIYLVYRTHSFKKRKTRTHIMRPTSKEPLVKIETGWSDMPEVNYLSNALHRLHRGQQDRVFYKRPHPPQQKSRSLSAAIQRRLPSLGQLLPAKLRTTHQETTAVLHETTADCVAPVAPSSAPPVIKIEAAAPEITTERAAEAQHQSRGVFVIPTPTVPSSFVEQISKKIREATARPRTASNGHRELSRSRSDGTGKPRRIEVKPWTGAELATVTVLHHNYTDESPSRNSTNSTASSAAASLTDSFDKLEPAYKPQNIRKLLPLPSPEDPNKRRSSLPTLVHSRATAQLRLPPSTTLCRPLDPPFRYFPPAWREVLRGDESLPLIADVIRTHENYLRRRKAGKDDGKKTVALPFGIGL